MARTNQHPWLNRFVWLTAVATFALIGLGGLVTSHGAGMAVPDWPTTYGYNMFLFPFRLWTGGIFYEHTHRLFASFVGLLTTVLAVWIWIREPRRWVRWLGVSAFAAVVLQGILGGLRVTLFKDEIGVVHATLAQAFFVLVILIAFVISGQAEKLADQVKAQPGSVWLRRLTLGASGLILVQLILGASMRHQHAGLAVPDFPLAYGKIWPPMDAASIERMNQHRLGFQDFNPITAFQVGLHMTHRLVALMIWVLVAVVAWWSFRRPGRGLWLTRIASLWFGLISCQAVLGAATVWTNKAADVATGHVLLGALSLGTGAIFSWILVAAAGQVSPSRHGVSYPTGLPSFPTSLASTNPRHAKGML